MDPHFQGYLANGFSKFTFYLQKVGLGHGVQFSCWHNSIGNIKIYKRLRLIFVQTLTISDILKFIYFLPSKSRSKSSSTIFAMTTFDSKYQNLQDSHTFFAILYLCREYSFLVCDIQKVGKCHGVQIPRWHHSMVNIKIYKKKLTHMFALYLTISENIKL